MTRCKNGWRGCGWVAVGMLALAGCLVGCSGGQCGVAMDIPASDRTVVAESVTEAVSITLPPQPFNIHWRQSSQTPGVNGQARGDSDANAKGHAQCSAHASDGGSAWGEFQLGHALTHAGSEPIRMRVHLTIEYEHQAKASPADARDTESTLTLTAFLTQSNGRTLHREALATISSDDGPTLRSGTAEVEFEVVLDPGRLYDLVVTGRASAMTGSASETSSSIVVRQMQATLACQPMSTETTAEGQ